MSTANDGSAVRFGRWWWCWRRRRRSTTTRGPTMPTTMYHPRTIILLSVLALISVLLGHVDAAARTKAEESASSRGSAGRQKEAEPVIEEVTAKQLERLLNEKDFVAVYWCKCSITRVTIFWSFYLITNYSVTLNDKQALYLEQGCTRQQIRRNSQIYDTQMKHFKYKCLRKNFCLSFLKMLRFWNKKLSYTDYFYQWMLWSRRRGYFFLSPHVLWWILEILKT